MRSARPMIVRERYFAAIEKEIQRLLDELIYKPLVKTLCKPWKEIANAGPSLTQAVRDGSVWYENGRFFGEFNAIISRELKRIGARWHSLSRSWSLPLERLPPEISMALAQADSRARAIRQQVIETLDSMHVASIDQNSQVAEKYARTITWMDGDFQRALAGIAIPPKLTDDQRHILARDWGENLDKYIKDWAAENILALRQDVQDLGLRGTRAETLAKLVEHNYAVSKRKAKFLARQETALLMSKFQESRYRSMGIMRYRWSGALDPRERLDHRKLQGKVCAWTDPPVTNLRTGARNHPGEDYNCRCVAIPLLD